MKTLYLAVALALFIVACGGRVQESCGGIGGIQCDEGYRCDVRSSDPDALGTCIKGSTERNNVSAIDFCNEDAECVRQPSCCDCGVGTWVNQKYQTEAPQNCGTVCRCALQRAVGVCRDNRCVGEPA